MDFAEADRRPRVGLTLVSSSVFALAAAERRPRRGFVTGASAVAGVAVSTGEDTSTSAFLRRPLLGAVTVADDASSTMAGTSLADFLVCLLFVFDACRLPEGA